MPRTKLLEPHPNSLEAKADTETLNRIMRQRLVSDEDVRQMDTWERNGFVSGQSLDNPETML